MAIQRLESREGTLRLTLELKPNEITCLILMPAE